MLATCEGACGSGETLESLLDYLRRWRFGSVVEREPGEWLTRQQMQDRIVQRAVLDPAFRRELLENPWIIYLIALAQTQGLSYLESVCRVQEIRVMEETPEAICLVLPTCHCDGRAAGEAETPPASPGICPVCGVTLADGPGEERGGEAPAWRPGAAADRRALESLLMKRAARDKRFREQLLFRPVATYRECVLELCAGDLPTFLGGVRDIRVVPETDRSILIVLPAAELPAGQ